MLEHLNNSRDLMKNLSAAAHLIHGSSENRFTITYCPGPLSQEEIESVGFQYASLEQMITKYDPQVHTKPCRFDYLYSQLSRN